MGDDLLGAMAKLSSLSLRLLSSHCGKHFTTLRDANYHHRKLLSSSTYRKLQDINCTYTCLRHFTDVWAESFLRDLQTELQELHAQQCVVTATEPDNNVSFTAEVNEPLDTFYIGDAAQDVALQTDIPCSGCDTLHLQLDFLEEKVDGLLAPSDLVITVEAQGNMQTEPALHGSPMSRIDVGSNPQACKDRAPNIGDELRVLREVSAMFENGAPTKSLTLLAGERYKVIGLDHMHLKLEYLDEAMPSGNILKVAVRVDALDCFALPT